MNRKQLVTLIVILAVVAAVGLFVSNRRQQNWEQSSAGAGEKVYDKFPLNDIAQVMVTNSDGAVTLAKVDDQWVVKDRDDFPANFTQLGGFLQKVWDLKVGQPIDTDKSHLDRLGLDPATTGTNHPTVVDFKGKDGKLLTSLMLGKTYTRAGSDSSPYGGWPAGRYVMIPGKLTSVALVSEPFTSVTPKPESWLKKDFIKVQKIESIEVTHPEATNSWTLSRTNETGPWTLANAKPDEQLDKTKVSGLNSFLSYASFNDVVVGKSDADLGFDHPTQIAIDTFDKFHYDLTVGEKEGSNDRYLRLAVSADFPRERTPGKDEKKEDKEKLDKEFADNLKKQEDKLKSEQALAHWTYQVSKYTLDAGMKKRSELLAEKKKEEDTATKAASAVTPAKVEMPGAPSIQPN